MKGNNKMRKDDINVSNIKEGMEVKNYRDMCTLLNEPVLTSNSKESQIENWRRYFDFGRAGQKYIIEKIYDNPYPPKVKNESIFVKTIEFLLMCELANKEGYCCNYTKTKLFKLLGMINDNFYNYNRKEDYNEDDEDDDTIEGNNSEKKSNVIFSTEDVLMMMDAADSPCKEWEITHFYDRARQKINNILFSALNSMRRRCLIEYYEQMIIVQGSNHHVATNEEIEKIITVKKTVLTEMGYTSIPFNKAKSFYKNVNRRLKDLYGWKYTYREYKIIYTSKYMPNDIKVVTKEIQDEIIKNKIHLNFDIVAALNEQAKIFFKKNQDKVEEFEKMDDQSWNESAERLTIKPPFDYAEASGSDYVRNQIELSTIMISDLFNRL